MDSFFASVEERDHPRIKGLPIVVGSDPANGKGRGVVSTANYAARAYGIKSALPISRAWQLSQKAKAEGKPEVVFFEPNIKKYAGISSEIFAYIATRGELFEPASIDEAYLELRAASGESRVDEWEKAKKIAQQIQDKIQKDFGLSCSVGVGPNKLIAKIAAGRQKPHGLTVVRESEVQAFLDPLSVRELLGIGPKTGAKLAEIKIETIKELRQLTKKSLVERFGEKTGEHMYESARGIDERPIEENREAKSIGSETTFDVDTLDAPKILATFKELAREVALSVKKEGKRFKTIAIVVRFSDFQTQTRSHTIGEPSDDGKVLEMEGLKLLLPFFDKRENPKHKNIRLVGVRAENLL
jgi:DNA polymerase IV (DinB-like DNA polymerase)